MCGNTKAVVVLLVLCNFVAKPIYLIQPDNLLSKRASDRNPGCSVGVAFTIITNAAPRMPTI
jgi:hypothetical protein